MIFGISQGPPTEPPEEVMIFVVSQGWGLTGLSRNLLEKGSFFHIGYGIAFLQYLRKFW